MAKLRVHKVSLCANHLPIPRARRTSDALLYSVTEVGMNKQKTGAPLLRTVGVITFADVADVIEEEAEEDIKALGGVTRDDELSDSVWTAACGHFN